MDPMEFEVEVEDLGEVTSRDLTAGGGDNDGTDGSSDFI